MSTLIPYLRFNDEKCREAFAFYQECFGGGKTTFQTVGESPMAKDMPAEVHNRIMHATFEMGDIKFAGSDMMRDKAIIGDNVVIALNPDSEAELRTIFDKLARGGEVFMAPEEAFWGAIFSMVTDKYGIEWMLNFDKNAGKK